MNAGDRFVVTLERVTDHPRRGHQRITELIRCCVAAASLPARFMAAIIEALRRAIGDRDVGEEALQLLSLDGQVAAEAVAVLADDLERTGGTSVLVVDDFDLTGVHGAEAVAQLLGGSSSVSWPWPLWRVVRG